jgi:hypothetical protein
LRPRLTTGLPLSRHRSARVQQAVRIVPKHHDAHRPRYKLRPQNAALRHYGRTQEQHGELLRAYARALLAKGRVARPDAKDLSHAAAPTPQNAVRRKSDLREGGLVYVSTTEGLPPRRRPLHALATTGKPCRTRFPRRTGRRFEGTLRANGSELAFRRHNPFES